jgi:tripartite-type tricarboxylate transporter receptor subunit TctC
MKQPDAVAKLDALGFDSILSTPDEFAARVKVDIGKWAGVIKAANIKIE